MPLQEILSFSIHSRIAGSHDSSMFYLLRDLYIIINNGSESLFIVKYTSVNNIENATGIVTFAS